MTVAEPPLTNSSLSPELCVRFLTQPSLGPAEIDAWRQLAGRSCHQNPFLLPEFVLAAGRYVNVGPSPILAVVEEARSGLWMALAVLTTGHSTRRLPWPHCRTFEGLYCFRSGILLDAFHSAAALDTLLATLTARQLGHGLEIPLLRLDSVLARELKAAAEREGYSWQIYHERQSPAVFPGLVSEDYLQRHLSKNRRKSLRQQRRRLEAQAGPVQLRIHQSPAAVQAALSTFLNQEAASWKGVQGTALLNHPRHTRFIHEMTQGLAVQNQVWLSELTAGEAVVATALNFVVGDQLFAFKIGWNIDFAKHSPGILHEAELLAGQHPLLKSLTLLDSCAGEDSYLANLWPERIPIGTGLLCTTRRSRWSTRVLNYGRQLKRAAQGFWPQNDAPQADNSESGIEDQ